MLINRQQVKTYLNVNESEYDTYIDGMIDQVGAVITNYCGQNIEAGETIHYTDGNDLNTILLKEFPVNSITSVEQRADNTSTLTALASTDYFLLKGSGKTEIYNTLGWVKGSSNYKITFNSGYTTVPLDVQKVAIEMVAISFKESEMSTSFKGGRLGMNQINENMNGISANIQFKNMWTDWEQILKRYRVPVY